MDKGVAAAARQFPVRASAIECLETRDESFREICVDFGGKSSMDPKRDERCSVWEELVAALSKEIE